MERSPLRSLDYAVELLFGELGKELGVYFYWERAEHTDAMRITARTRGQSQYRASVLLDWEVLHLWRVRPAEILSLIRKECLRLVSSLDEDTSIKKKNPTEGVNPEWGEVAP